MKTLISIMGHAEAQGTFERHYPLWLEHTNEGAELLFWFPQGQEIKGIPFPSQSVGKAQHDGPAAIIRFRTILEHMAQLTAYDRFAFFEYDSFVLGKLPDQSGYEMMGNIFLDKSDAWLGEFFVHPPFFVESSALRTIVREFKKLPFDCEAGMWDRQLGLAAGNAHVLCKSFIGTGYGFSRNTIHEADEPEFHKAIIDGAHAIHGCKSESCFKTAMKAWELRHHIDEVEKAGYIVGRKQAQEHQTI